ncbi:type II toxin-antitoxin system RelE/ParE family toxin [Acidicapsa dinghuensis]|uniref:Type II toxin-antitoxin system RelE/ParE family toxin n=1 Tax=Acidicapsa dinghuensis TaxID=2218256 RepID=A0ABW1ELW6_9BACT|nr:type II toxin-antitoxin system RelE/ParE family toxin [Acidicapsa dinghuensis]
MNGHTLCTFAGFVSEAGGRLVQEWYDDLPEEEKEEIQDTLNYLASIPPAQWKRPEFDKLDKGLHEIGCRVCAKNHWIRIYGIFDPQRRGRFIFLYGNAEKKVKNDTRGKNKSLERASLLKQGKASTHEFVIEAGVTEENSQKQRGKKPTG